MSAEVFMFGAVLVALWLGVSLGGHYGYNRGWRDSADNAKRRAAMDAARSARMAARFEDEGGQP